MRRDRNVIRVYQIFVNGTFNRDFTGTRDELNGLVAHMLNVENIKANMTAFCRYEDGRLIELNLTFGY